ncbi:MAG: tetratricopeptide repeat protein [Acidimicrobiia bacterium]|nr:tetratricopeptide repeat protein [Acidimicrobiia bacterium]
MSRWVRTGIVAGAAIVLGWAFITSPTGSLDADFVGDKIACPKCEGESIAASQTQTARAMMEVVEEQITEGRSEREILDWFAARYGPDIVLEPPLDLGGYLLWAVPIATVAGGAWLAFRRRDESTTEAEAPPAPTSPLRVVLTIGGAAVVLTGLAFGIGTFVEPRATGSPVSGNLEAPSGRDLSEVSNEEMEAVLEQFADVPEANRMRLALARRYFEEQDFGSAVGHFQTVLASDPTPVEASEALGRIGWILFVNGEVASSEAAFLQALDALPSNSEAKWFYAILLVEEGRQDEAVPLLEELADDPTVPAEALAEIERLIAEAGA